LILDDGGSPVISEDNGLQDGVTLRWVKAMVWSASSIASGGVAGHGQRASGGGDSVIDVVVDLLQGKTRGWSVKTCTREGRRRCKKSVALAHGFDDEDAK
jgi:hypothetical protein